MSPTGNSQLTERLPLELLEKVLAYASISDILKMKQVRTLYNPRPEIPTSDVVSFSRSLAVSTISSRNHLTPNTESIYMLQGWRTTPT
jgi:hypothetical protein